MKDSKKPKPKVVEWPIAGYKGKRDVKDIYRTYTKSGRVRKPKQV